ncbi:MAG TPA: hypothetical protein VJ698_06755 [Noviherbaspirillum sp.]|uniref:hypothetical protein n=1 Tax=Noviherbaspirillum sp. TaxID=1926288 RepID=UPI002B492512|nr:hypothetical protein [Noviherbaspirillum sp.]HJV85159.1 hypothetical protein [Noviherbaspirillum sp.]
MPLNLLYPPGPLYTQYRAVEDALNFLDALHVRQTALKSSHPDLYDVDVHICLLAFNLRVVGRKLDSLVAAFQAVIQTRQVGSLSQRSLEIQAALQEYNASVAATDPWDNPFHAAVNALGLAFDYLRSVEEDIQQFEQQNPT